MKSTKILTLNPIPSGVNQKYVSAKKYNELWDDVKALEGVGSGTESFATNWGPTVTPNTISLVAYNGIAVQVFNDTLTTCDAVFRLSDIIRSVSYNGSGTVKFSYKIQGASWSTPVTDPVAEIVHIKSGAVTDACNQLGTLPIQVKASDGVLVDAISETYALIQDMSNIC